MYPFPGGGANWGSSAFDPARNLLIINMSNLAHIIRLTKGDKASGAEELDHGSEFAPMKGAPYGMTRATFLSSLGLPCTKPPWGALAAVDLDSGHELWKGRLPAGGQATPMSYGWNGKQYVVIAADGHSSSGTKFGDHVVAFALPD